LREENNSNNIDWSDSEETIITSIDHINKLINEGYEIKAKRFEYKHNLGSRCTLLMTKENKRIIADANRIIEYWANIVELYNFEKNTPMFVWVPDTTVYWKFEEALLMLPSSNPNIQMPLKNRRIITSKSTEIYNSLLNWMNNERFRTYGITKISEIFSLICIIEEKNKIITRKTFGKERITLQQINLLKSTAKNLDSNTALSFFLLSKKLGPPDQFGDLLIGLILYDLKNEETIAFNIQSLTSLIQIRDVDKRQGLYDVGLCLFNRSLNKELVCNSYLPLPLDSPWYTALPWLSYSALLPIKLDSNNKEQNLIRNISIPEFFTFGHSTDARYGNSFDFSYFSSDHAGRTVCILNLNEETKTLKYVLRFDQSQGEPLVHIDFAYHDTKEFNLISHRPLVAGNILEKQKNLYPSLLCRKWYLLPLRRP